MRSIRICGITFSIFSQTVGQSPHTQLLNDPSDAS
jgi:hypothetical protein